MTVKTIRQALHEALEQEMRRDPRVVVIGEDVSGGAGTEGGRDAAGGVLGVTKGLIKEFGEARVIDTPITEFGDHGRRRGCGGDRAAAGGGADVLRLPRRLLRPDLQPGGQVPLHVRRQGATPLVIRTMIGAGRSAAAQHSQSPYHIFTSVPGLKVVVPSNAYDAKGLLIQAIRDDDPVIFCEHKLMYDLKTEVPDEAYVIPFGEANVVRDGDDVTVVALARMVHYAIEAADDAGRGRHRVRDHRPAHHLATGRGHHPGKRRTHRPAGGGGRSDAPLRHGDRHRGAGGRQGVRCAEGAGPAGHRAAHAGAVRAVAGEALHSGSRTASPRRCARCTATPDDHVADRDHHAQMGSDDDRGQGGAMAARTGRVVRAGRRIAGDRDLARSPTSSKPNPPARCCASSRRKAAPCRSAACSR